MNPESRPWLYPLVLLGVVVVFVGVPALRLGLISLPQVAAGAPSSEAETATPQPTPTLTEVTIPSLTPEERPSAGPPDVEQPATLPSVQPTDTPSAAQPTEVPTPLTESPTPAPPTETPEPIPDPTPTPEAVVISESGLNLRYGPGLVYDPPVGYLRTGAILDIIGRIATNEWVEVITANGQEGWISASPKYLKINLDLSTIPVVGIPPAPAPALLEPPDDTRIDICNRLDLFWTWNGTLGPDEYFQVEIWNRFNDFDEPIDVAWIKVSIYRYDYLDIGYHPDYKWRVTVVKGIPAREKDWSTSENPVWEPSDQYEPISEPSATWRLMVDCSPPPPQPQPTPSGGDERKRERT